MKRNHVMFGLCLALVVAAVTLCIWAAPSSVRWEYTYVYATRAERGNKARTVALAAGKADRASLPAGMDVVVKKLNDKGADGWELVGITPNKSGMAFSACYLFKRRAR